MAVLSGDEGKLTVGYRFAATLHKWIVTRQQDALGAGESILLATVSAHDDFYVTQTPMVLGLMMGPSWWVWQEIEVDGKIETGKQVSIKLVGNPVARSSF